MADLYPFKNSHSLSVSTRQALMTMLTAGLLALLALTLPQKAWANGPIHVDKDAPGPVHDGVSWTTAYTDVLDALAAATPGDEIWVAEGVYTPGNTLTASFYLTNGVALYGGFGGYGIGETLRTQRDWAVHVTVLSGDIDHNDIIDPNGVITTTANITGNNAYHVVTGSGTDTAAVLDGFTVTGGTAIGVGTGDERGGGMLNVLGNPTLTNVTFSGNYALHGGGGIFNFYGDPTLTNVIFSHNRATRGGGMHNQYSSPTLIDVTFSRNSAGGGGGMSSEYGSPTLTNVTFSRNSAASFGGGGIENENSNPRLNDVTFSGNSADSYGGGMLSRGGSLALTNATFSDNSAGFDGGGMYSDNSSLTLTNIAFGGNSAGSDGGGTYNISSTLALINVALSGNSAGDRGGGLYTQLTTPITLTNVIFSGNQAVAGGGMFNDIGNLTLTNVTFSHNSAESGGGMYYQDPFYISVLINCIFWSNTAPVGPQIYNETDAPSVAYSLVHGGYPGTGNIDADPLFVDADGPDNIVGTLDDDLRLQLVSPAIDAGDNSAVPADTADLDGDGDTAEPLPLDLAGNPRFIDIADKADTGNGTAPIVDMGAYETVVAGPLNYCYLPIVLKNWVRYGTP
jgi:predicted outer membrane repeat protein